MRAAVPVLVLGCLAGAATPVSVQSPTGAGAIALLALHDGHAIDSDLKQALRDPDPQTRMLAGRVIGVLPHPELFQDLVAALAREQDRAVGAELVRNALYAGGDQALELVEPAVKRLGFGAAAAVAEWTGRMHPDRFIDSLPAITSAAGTAAWRLPPLIDMVAAQHPASRDAVFAAWMAVAPARSWGDLLDLAYGLPIALDTAVPNLRAALASPRPSVREESVWFLVYALAEKRKVPTELIDAALPRAVADTTEWEQYGRELMARRFKKARTADRTDLLTREAGPRHVRRALAELPDLSRNERDAVAKLVETRPGLPTTAWRTGAAATRTMSLPGAGALAGTLAAAGCQAGPDLLGAAQVSYRPDGRPRGIRLDQGNLAAPCVRALTVLARLSVAESDYPAGESVQTVLLPLHPAFLQCTGRVNTDAEADLRGRPAVIAPPRKVRDAKPFYPERAQQERIQGVVVIAASVTDRGCVASARVSRSFPYLDIPALVAVTQWAFEPPLVDGQISPMELTITVSFKLQ